MERPWSEGSGLGVVGILLCLAAIFMDCVSLGTSFTQSHRLLIATSEVLAFDYVHISETLHSVE